ncbi:MAG: phage tail tube protein [Magnetococcus sp. MYC-9]
MPFRARQRLILAKMETAYGVDPLPTATDALLVRNIALTPLDGGTVDRRLVTPYLGAQTKLQTNVSRKLEFEVDTIGAGAAGTAPVWSRLVKACATSEVIHSGVSAVYAPTSTNFGSITLYHHISGQLAKLLGARGTFSLALSANAIPVFKFSFVGLWSPQSSTSQPSPTYTDLPTPQIVSMANTPVFAMFGQSMVMKSFDINMGLDVKHRSLVGYDGVEITDRSVTASLSCEWPQLSVLDPESLAKNGTLGALQFIHGTTAGNILQIDAPNIQILEPRMSEDEGVMMLQCTLLFQPSSGNDEIVFTAR